MQLDDLAKKKDLPTSPWLAGCVEEKKPAEKMTTYVDGSIFMVISLSQIHLIEIITLNTNYTFKFFVKSDFKSYLILSYKAELMQLR